ncbi:RHS repeat-associated core domain-containing protein [Flagellimonas lutimaris]|uniref:RHS repeat-associated core domain-containing protein n=1 Tax=Flagellimonas lutimaris TaxID=475082 RepID=UPI0039C4329A
MHRGKNVSSKEFQIQETSLTKSTSLTTRFANSTVTKSTSDKLSVTLAGGVNYSIPIEVPPGLNGVQPEISINYDSHSGNGLAGWGWNISGISVITRVPSTLFHDNIKDGVDFDAYDRFSLDGQRLVVKTGTYGLDGAIYQTESYSNLKIISYGSHPDSGVQGPSSFKVLYPDGSIGYYGVTSNSRTQTDYAISYWENPQGVRIDYEYAKTHNSLSIDKITYGTRSSSNPINVVEFVYTDRTRPEQAYINGVSFIRKNLLEEIHVKANGVGFRNYYLSHEYTSLFYDQLVSVQEKSGDNSLSKATISFDYDQTQHSIGYQEGVATTLTVSDLEQRNAEVVPLDFTGNGKMDFIVYPTFGTDRKKKFWLFTDIQNGAPNYSDEVNTGTFLDIFPVNLMTDEYKLMAQQGLVTVQNSGSSNVTFKVYGQGPPSTSGAPIPYYTKTWSSPTYNTESSCETGSYDYRISQKYLSGDFDGDGLSDVIAISLPYSYTNCIKTPLAPGETCDGGGGPNPLMQTNETQTSSVNDSISLQGQNLEPLAAPGSGGDYCCECNQYSVSTSQVNLIKLDRRITSGFTSSVGSLSSTYNYSDKYYTLDVNGDGKTDILKFSNSKVEVYSLNESNSYLVKLWETNDTALDLDFPIMPGDYNGDGKIDFMIPTANNSNNFKVFLSEGNNFDSYNETQPFEYKYTDFDSSSGTLYGYYLIPIDINGDSRTDVLEYKTITQNGSSNGTQTLRVHRNDNTSSTNVKPRLSSIGSTISKTGNLKHFPIPIFLSPENPNNNLDFAAISDKYVTSFSFAKDHREDITLKSITNNGITTEIKYDRVQEEYVEDDISFFKSYTSTNLDLTQLYPFVNTNVSPSFKVVRELVQTGAGYTRTKQYYYKNAVSHAHGLGFLGFEQIKESNWFGSEVPDLWTISKYDPLLRGSITEQIIANDYVNDNPSIYMSKVNYFYDYLLIANPGSTSAPQYVDNITRSTLLSAAETDIVEHSITLTDGFHAIGSNGAYWGYVFPPEEQPGDTGYAGAVDIVLASKETHHGLTGVSTTETYTYDKYNNPLTTTTTFPDGSKTLTFTYANNPSANNNSYYIGRITNKKESTTLNGNIFEIEEHFSFTNNLVSQIKKKGNGTNWVTEDFTHDINGNVLTKTLTANDLPHPRTEIYEYSTSYGSRFLTKSIDILGLETVFTYDNNTGDLLTSTDHFNLTTTSTYDKWGRLSSVTDYRNNTTNYSYNVVSGGQKNTIEYPDGAKEETIYNLFGWKIKSGVLSLNSQWIYTSYEYLLNGNLWRVSEPHNGSPSQWNSYEYDEYGRPTEQVLYNGRTITNTYSGLSTTTNDGIKTIINNYDSLGNIIQTSDPGGTIDYTYFANGTLKTADYGGHTITVGIDGWGRKISLNDPSAGTYTYNYNDLGELLEETTPKGSTIYDYDDYGRLIVTTKTGDLTDHSLEYIYDDANTKLLKTINGFDNTNGARAYTYQYTYNNYNEPYTITEDTGLASFEYRSIYDTFGRVSKETYISTLAGGVTKTLVTRNEYDSSGLLTEIWNDGTPDKLWELNTINARGQALTVNLGNGMVKTKMYDTYGYPTKFEDKESGTNPTVALHVDYDFNQQQGTLNSRENFGFNWQETFTHDNLDRLTVISGDVTHSMSYDTRGRIDVNSDLGDYAYTDTSKKYRLMEIDANAIGDAYYQQHPTQQISYNAFKKPIEIHQAGHGRVSFEYGPMMARSTAYYGGEQSNKIQRRYIKHYSTIIPVEIVEDTQTNNDKIITYIGGDAYTAPIVHIKTTGTGAIDEYHYLHRDYLGSILAITDADGDVKEERQFGAWGSVDQFLDSASGTAFTHASLLGRGYTGHEHFFEVGLIHMNGRMYDAQLGRFLSPDNYIQDTFNTQNYNRFSYVLNSPLKYVDPSGEFFAETALAIKIIGYAVSAIGALIIADSFFDFGIFPGANVGYNASNIKPGPTPNNVGGSQNTSTSISNSSRESKGGPGLGNTLLDTWNKINNFRSGGTAGFLAGAKSSWDFVKSLGTRQGWKDMGQGFVNLYEMSQPTNYNGMVMRAELGQSVEKVISDIPQMSAYEIGYGVGYGTEKIVEGVLVSKGAGVVVNTAKSSGGLATITKGLKFTKRTTGSGTSLGAARSSVRNYLKNVSNLSRDQLIGDLESAGFKKVFEGKGMQHFQRGDWKIRLDPPQKGTPFNHMHINKGGNKNAFDIFLNPVHYKSPSAHIPIN